MILVASAPKEMLRHAIGIIDEAATPATDSAMYAALAWLSAVTAMREGSEDQGELRLTALASVLAGYPGGISIPAIREWTKTRDGKWWPTAAEMHAMCAPEADWRRRLREELERAAAAPEPQPIDDRGRWPEAGVGSPERQFVIHAAIKIGHRDHAKFETCVQFSRNGIHTTPMWAARLSEPDCDALRIMYGVQIHDDFEAEEAA